MFTFDQAKAAGRHGLTAAASIVGTLAALKVLSGGDAQAIQTSLNQIGHGAAELAAGISALIVGVSGAYAAISANPLWQLIRGTAAVKADPASAVAGASYAQKTALLDATAALPEVVGPITVTDPALVTGTSSEQVVKTEGMRT